MPRNGSGTFNRIYDWTTDQANGINCEADRMDEEFDGIATALSNSIAIDGQTTITANIPFNSKKITGLANGSARTDSIALGQVQDNTYGTLGTLGGSADTYTASPSPAITAYATGSEFNLKVNATNTGASTLNVSAVGAKTIKKYDGAGSKVDLEAGDLQQDQYYKVIYDGTDFVLNNPEAPYLKTVNLTKSTTTAYGVSYLSKQIIISNGTDSDHDIDFTAGNFNFDDGTGQAVATALTKQIDSSWVAGDNAGGLDTGTVAADTTYHCFAIWNPTTETADFLFSTSLASPTLPSGYTKKTRVGSIITNSSSNIILFVQRGKEFILKTKITEVNISSSIPTSLTDLVVTSPNGLITSVLMGCHIQTNATAYKSPTVFAKDKNLDTEVIIGADGRGSDFTGKTMNNFSIYSDTNSTIQYRATDSGTWNLQIFCFGWVDYQL